MTLCPAGRFNTFYTINYFPYRLPRPHPHILCCGNTRIFSLSQKNFRTHGRKIVEPLQLLYRMVHFLLEGDNTGDSVSAYQRITKC